MIDNRLEAGLLGLCLITGIAVTVITQNPTPATTLASTIAGGILGYVQNRNNGGGSPPPMARP